MPLATVTTSIGSRTSDSVTVSAVTSASVTGFTNAWTVTLNATVPATTVKGDKLTIGTDNYLIVEKSGSNLTVVSDSTAIPATSNTEPAISSATTSRMYSTPALWAAGVASSLVTKEWIWRGELYKEGTGTNGEWLFTTQSSGMGSTVASGGAGGYDKATNGSYYYELTAAAGQSFQDHPNKNTNKLQYNPEYGVALRTTANYVRFFLSTVTANPVSKVSRLQFKSYRDPFNTTYHVPEFKDCIMIGGPGYGVKCTNCLILSNAIPAYNDRYINCTLFWPFSRRTATAFPHEQFGSTVTVRNCAVFNFSYGLTLSSGYTGRIVEAQSGNNITDSQSFGWTNSSNVVLADPQSQFQEIRTITNSSWTALQNYIGGVEDFRVRRGSQLIGAGVRDQTYTNDLDILGNPRSTTAPTVGCHEFSDSYYSGKKSSLQIGRVGKPYLIKCNTQPLGNVQIDWGNSLTTNMSFAWTASAGYIDSVSGNLKNHNVNVEVIRSAGSSKGVVQQTTTDGTVIWGIRGRTVNAVNNPFTIGVAFQIRNLAADNSSIFSVTTGGSAYNRIGFVASKVQASTTQANTTVNSNDTVAVGDWVYAVYVLQNGNYQLYVNGIKQTEIGSGTLPSVLPTPYNYVELAPSRVNILTAFVVTKPWTQTQVTEWTKNPWQIFKPAQSKLYSFQYSYSENTRPRSDLITATTNAIAATTIDCSVGTYFTKTITGNTTLSVINVPSTGVYKLALRLIVNSGTVTWWSGVTWPESNTPYLTPGRSHLLIFQTTNGGTSWRGSYVLDYAS